MMRQETPGWSRTKTFRRPRVQRMNIGTSRRCGPSIGNKKVFFSGLRSVLPFIGIFFFVRLGMPWITA